MMPRLKDYYKNEIVNEILKKFSLKNKLMVPKIDKVILNMGLGQNASDKKILQNCIEDNSSVIINVMSSHDQGCLIKNTMDIVDEVHLLNEYLERGDKNVTIILYGKHTNDMKVYDKYNQLIQLGFTNVGIYIGGLFL